MEDLKPSFKEKLAAAKARLQISEPTALPPEPSTGYVRKSDVPEVQYERTQDQNDLDSLLERLDILDAYSRWCGKMHPNPRGKRESIMVSCPDPGHPDKVPSAWVNLDKQTWFCGGCQVGGDKYDIAALNLGISNYKDGANFHKLREKMAGDLGYVVRKTPGGQEYLQGPPSPARETQPPAPSPPGISPGPQAPSSASGVQNVQTVSEVSTEDDPDADIIYPSIDWQKIIPKDTFLDTWMKECTRDDLPEEYYFWLGLQAVGFAIGRDAYLIDHTPVLGNLFVCLLGRSGVGKSRSSNALGDLLHAALPYDYDDPTSTGILAVAEPGSAEALIDTFAAPVYDPARPKVIAYYAPVRGLLKFGELSALAAKASRAGSAMKPTLMEFYDGIPIVQTKSRTGGLAKAEKPFCSTVTSSQPKAIRELLSKSDLDSGFVNRWIFAVGPEKPKFAYMGVALKLDDCVPKLKSIKAWSSLGVQMMLEGDALKKWNNFFHDIIEPTRKHDENDLYTRVDLTLKKIILLLSANKMEKTPSYETVDEACSLFEYLISAYNTVEKNVQTSKANEMDEYILDRIRKLQTKNPEGVTLRDICRSIRKKGYENEAIIRCVKNLSAVSALQEHIQPSKTGQSKVLYRLPGDD